MKMHICLSCHGVLYGYPETTRYYYACNATTKMSVKIVDYDNSGNASNAYPASTVFEDFAMQSSRPSKINARRSTSQKCIDTFFRFFLISSDIALPTRLSYNIVKEPFTTLGLTGSTYL
ncbi:hypothetical protein HI914_05371 [Erysiphe necator]|nr:hypothetical protein HI914_05371 [Erysiphe necator]